MDENAHGSNSEPESSDAARPRDIAVNDGRAHPAFAGTYDVLLDNFSFISRGEGDEHRYFVPAEALDALTWAALNLGVPMLTGVGSSLIANVLQGRGKDRRRLKVLESSPDELQEIEAETQGLLTHPHDVRPQAREEAASRSLAELLEENGWPSAEAKADANRIIDVLLQREPR